MMKVIPLPLMYLIMSLVIPFYLIFNHSGYLAIYHYFRKRHSSTPLGAFFRTWHNHIRFGEIIMDRFAAYAGKKFDVDVENPGLFYDNAPDGFVQISSHIGNDEMAGYVLKTPKRLNALIFNGEDSAISENRNKLLNSNNIRLIPISSDLSHLLLINEALASGEIVNIHGDRVFGSKKTFRCKVLGAEAELPAGPFLMASMRDARAIAVFVLKTGLKRYKALLYDLTVTEGNVRERAEAMAANYAGVMGGVLEKYPDQWFNYYEFWDE